MANDRFIQRSMTDEIMYALMELSGTEYVDVYAAKAKEDGKVGEIPSIPAGKSAAVTIDLTAGKYVFICNVAGHYQLGMHTGFTVDAP